MKQIRLKVAEVFEVEPEETDRPSDIAAITAYVLKHYAFLRKPIAVTLDGDEVVISYPGEDDTKRAEAVRLADRAVKRASEGQYDKAIDIYKRVLELQPSFHAARRDLAMAYMEVGDIENATLACMMFRGVTWRTCEFVFVCAASSAIRRSDRNCAG